MTHNHIEKTLMHVTQEENMACKLKKAIYGVKQRSRDWFDKFDRIISEVGFEKCYFRLIILSSSTRLLLVL